MSGFCKYYKQKKQVSYDSGATWQDVVPAEYQKGSLYEPNSTDCGYIASFERWVESGTTCDGTNLYKLEVFQTSVDGIHWETTSQTKLGDLVEMDSDRCDSQYRWVETDEYGCHKANMPLGNYKICGYRYQKNQANELIDSLEWYEIPCGYRRDFSVNAQGETLCGGDLTGEVTIFDTAQWPLGGIQCYSATDIKTAFIGDCVNYIDSRAFGNICHTNIQTPTGPEYCRITQDGNTKLESVIMSDSVVGISNQAFINCWNLKYIELSENLEYIGSEAFKACDSLSGITLPESLDRIGAEAFIHCDSLSSITVPTNVTTIGYDAFYYCNGLKNATINASGLTSFKGLFLNCSGLISVTLPEGLALIDESAFAGCTSLSAITIPSSVTDIRFLAFSHCESLTEITIPSGITEMREKIFTNCTNLRSITCLATTPPAGIREFSSDTYNVDLGDNLDNLEAIYVPMESVDLYKSIDYCWYNYRDLIVGINT